MENHEKISKNRKILAALFWVSSMVEALLSVAAFFFPARTVELFGLLDSTSVRFLGEVLGWFFLLVAALCAWGATLARKNVFLFWQLGQLLGVWWVGIGLYLAVKHGRFENLILDSLKGALLYYFAEKVRAEET